MAHEGEELNFNIQDTFEVTGNQELLAGLEEQIQEDNLETIVKTITETTTTAKKAVPETTQETTTRISLNKLLEDEGGEEEEEEEEDVLNLSGNPPKTEEKEEEEQEGNYFENLSNDLFRLGVFTKGEDEDDVVIDTDEKFLERFNLEKKNGASQILDNFIGKFGEDYQNAFNAIFVNGANPKDYFDAYNKIYDFSELDMTQESNQERVVLQGLRENGYEPDDANEELRRVKEYGDLEGVSKRMHKMLLKKEGSELKRIEEEAAAKQAEKLQAKNLYVQNVQKILQDKIKTKEFDGIPLTPKTATELEDFLLVEKYRTPSGETLTEFDKQILSLKRPENHALKVKVALLMKLIETDPTLSTIQKVGVTKETNALFGELNKIKTKKAQLGKSGSTPVKWNNL